MGLLRNIGIYRTDKERHDESEDENDENGEEDDDFKPL